MAVIENEFPFKIYEARNLATSEAYVYLGKASIAGLNGANENYFSHQADANCFTTFLFASIVGGRNVRIDAATEDDPYIYIDSRWYDFRPCGVESNDQTTWPANGILSHVDYKDNGDVVTYFKSITSDGSIVIEGGNPSFVWSDEGPAGNQFNSGNAEDCNLILKAHKYIVANACETNGILQSTQGVPGASDVVFYLKSIVGGSCINVTDTGSSLVISFDLGACDPCSFCSGSFSTTVDEETTCSQWIPSEIGVSLN
jgi:hypothetical protein